MKQILGNLFPYKGQKPRLANSVFTAPGSVVVGDVEMGENCSVWYNTVVRGDVNYIRIGKETNVQDLSMLHVTNKTHPLIIGDKVTIGHSVTLHGCTIENLCLIGMGAVILDGARVESGSIVGAGALIPPNFVVPSGSLAIGVPAKIVRTLSDSEIEELHKSAQRYIDYSADTIQSLTEENTD
ncbi:MAG: gamma carbonic anhydrase family protein [Melioribacteraceae bacterium]|nr:MAG: gamma carbonic anhydrase family protein [Melioribacteraceae bacterium]